MKILRQLWNQKGLDAAVENVPEDRYGFRNIAEKYLPIHSFPSTGSFKCDRN
uniref:Uncharacterized protein n=1 Tax=Klebsiella pneumoniae TaxID=573 RepID=A0A8B0T001_KLEPN|nr:hypothetical protein [Klebsiella pneumoniae]